MEVSTARTQQAALARYFGHQTVAPVGLVSGRVREEDVPPLAAGHLLWVLPCDSQVAKCRFPFQADVFARCVCCKGFCAVDTSKLRSEDRLGKTGCAEFRGFVPNLSQAFGSAQLGFAFISLNCPMSQLVSVHG